MFLRKVKQRQTTVVQACNPSSRGTLGGRMPEVSGRSEMQSEFKAILKYIVRPCFKKQRQKKQSKRFQMSIQWKTS